ncbi:OLC1v1008965C1, partial [Oldenlandia corymbosa var. corymbosa]
GGSRLATGSSGSKLSRYATRSPGVLVTPVGGNARDALELFPNGGTELSRTMALIPLVTGSPDSSRSRPCGIPRVSQFSLGAALAPDQLRVPQQTYYPLNGSLVNSNGQLANSLHEE